MSDPFLEEEDDLISQDDIDKLLDISSEDDDTGELSQDDIDSLLNGPGPDEDDSDAGEEDAGELSQDDIDSLMSGNALDDDDASEDDDAGELSQDDIDNLLNGPGPDEDDSGAGEEDAGELSQDDIDSLMSGNALDDDASEDDDVGELSQDDIDNLLNGPGPDEDDSGAGKEEAGELSRDDIEQFMNDSKDLDSGDDDELISLEDIQDVMNDESQENDGSYSEPDLVSAGDAEPEAFESESNQNDGAEQKEEGASDDNNLSAEASDPEKDPFNEPINEDQAADVADCMITQEAMDALIEGGLPAPDVLQEDAGAPEADVGDSADDNLPDEIALTPEADGGDPEEASQENDDDVTQEDIDALLQQSDAQDELLDEDEDILISQDDINTLLMAADQEDEDVLGDIGENNTSALEDQLDDGFDDLKSDSDQVVLEDIADTDVSGENDPVPAAVSKKGGKIKALLRSKVILAAASVLLCMGISVPISYFLFFSSEPVPLPKRQSASLTQIDLIRDGQTNISSEMPGLPPSRRPGTIVLTDFIILASDQSQTMTYVYADVSIDYSDQRAYDEISSNLAFYRDLIYGAIQTRLVSENNNEVTEADLLWGVEASLKKVLPPQYIDKISFKSFKTT